jgi:hypothetical protein
MVLLLAAGVNAQAQRVPPPVPRPRAAVPPAPNIRPPNGLQGRIANLPPRWIEQLQAMGPAEQERFLSNNARFRSLPAQRQAQIRRRLRAWNNLPLDQRRALLERQPSGNSCLRSAAPSANLLPRWQICRSPVARQS